MLVLIMNNRIVNIILLLCIVFNAGAVSFTEIRSMGVSGKTVALSGTLEAFVTSDWRSTNTETGENLSDCIVNVGASLQTAYIQNAEGTLGFRVKFKSIYGNRLEKGSKVSIDLAGCTLLKEENPDRYTIGGVDPKAITVISLDNPIVARKIHIAELTDEDVYTYVTLEGLEFRKKEGGYINVNEKVVQISSLNEGLSHPKAPGYKSAQENADAWPTLMRDDRGKSIYMIINSTCQWRRNNMGVPKGVGEVSGVIVHDDLHRYGNDLGRYSIRPFSIEDFNIPKEDSSSYEAVCAWEWDFNKYAELDFVAAGKIRFPRVGQIKDDSINAETGKGVLWTDTGASLTLDDEYDARHSFDGWKPARMTGSRSNAALRLDCKCGDWYKKTPAGGLYIKTSLVGVESDALNFNFSFVASREHSRNAENFPVDWKVSWSTDGETFTECRNDILLRPIAFHNVQHGSRPAIVHEGCAAGFLEFSIPLPLELLGKDVIMKVSPASQRTATLPETFDGPCCEGKANDVSDKDIIIRFGDISITYLKK